MAVRETYPIKGVPLPDPNQPPNSPVPLRREVNEWFRSKVDNDVIQVKLFLLALIHFEGMDVESQLSYFQVAGTLIDARQVLLSASSRLLNHLHLD